MGLQRPRIHKEDLFGLAHEALTGVRYCVGRRPHAVARREQIRIMSDFGLTPAEFKLLCGHASRNLEADAAWPRGIKRAYMEILKVADAKLKKELEFGPDQDVYMVPAFNPIKPKTSYITTAWSSSGGGKTTALCGLLMRRAAFRGCPKGLRVWFGGRR